jgi:hypothetical protein
MTGRFGLEGARGMGSHSGETSRGGTSVTGRGSSSAGQPKGEPTVLGRPVAVASASPEVGDGRGGGKRAGRLAGRRGSGPHSEKEAGPWRWWFGPTGRPRPRERGRWPAARPGRRRQNKRGGGGSRLIEGQGPGGWAKNQRWAQAQKEIPFEF